MVSGGTLDSVVGGCALGSDDSWFASDHSWFTFDDVGVGWHGFDVFGLVSDDIFVSDD